METTKTMISLNKKRLMICGVVFFIFLAVIFCVLLQSRSSFKENMDITWNTTTATGNSFMLKEGNTYTQSFTANEVFNSVALYFSYPTNVQTYHRGGTALISIIDENSGDVVLQREYDLGDTKNGDVSIIHFDQNVDISQKTKFVFCMEILSLDKGMKGSLCRSDDLSDHVWINGTKEADYGLLLGIGTPLSFSYRNAVLFFGLLIAVVFTVLTWFILGGKKQWHRIYLAIALTAGLVLLFMLPPMYGFDTCYHASSSYVLSDVIMGDMSLADAEKGSGVTSYPRRHGDTFEDIPRYMHEKLESNYAMLHRYLWTMPDEKDLRVETVKTPDLTGTSAPLLFYLPQALGMTLARLLHLNLFWLLLLARLFGYLALVALCTLAIKNSPFNKGLFFVVSLLPVVLIQGCTLSKDVLILGFSFYLISKTLQLSYGDIPLNWKTILPVVIASVLLAPEKMIYLPLCLFPLLIAFRRCGAINAWSTTQRGVVGGGTALVLGSFAFGFYMSASTAAAGPSVGIGGGLAYSVSYLLQNPDQTILLIFNLCRSKIGYLYYNSVATFEIDAGLTYGIVFLFTVLMLSAVLYREKNCETFEKDIVPIVKKDRYVFGIILLLVFLLAMAASILWTVRTATEIKGFQGRYLTPILPLLFLLIKDNPLIKIEKDLTNYIIFGTMVLICLIILNYYLWIITLM